MKPDLPEAVKETPADTCKDDPQGQEAAFADDSEEPENAALEGIMA
ncbi:MAG: hypothetical protein LBP88_08905 [Treponema sp.]|nr:hypothetical protein [Treponema sp.]